MVTIVLPHAQNHAANDIESGHKTLIFWFFDIDQPQVLSFPEHLIKLDTFKKFNVSAYRSIVLLQKRDIHYHQGALTYT